MTGVYLQRMVENLPDGVLPSNWGGFNLAVFSRKKNLWEYQQTALHNAILALWQYYHDYATDTRTEAERKHDFMKWYADFGFSGNLDLPLDRSSAAKRRLALLLETYYTAQDDKLPYKQFINRMSFWMATGSGKTLVIVKLIEILHNLIERKEIPTRDILVLAHRDNLLDQLRAHVDEFNSNGGLFIRLKELKEYPEVKRGARPLFASQEITIFYYRSDNLSDEGKDKIIDFRSYDNGGEWYILLDEAHKGDKEDSKRQHIYSIMSRNGFLFNFSATFTDDRDIVTTVANFNLSEFVRKGHGKHICILRQEARAFKKGDEYTDVEKQKIVLKALIMLAYTRKFESRVKAIRPDLYHRPLLMTLVNSVNTDDADLKLFFRELVRIADGKVDKQTWNSAKDELRAELRERPAYLYESGRISADDALLASLTQSDLLALVFNATGKGQIEVLARQSNNQEVAFKLKTSDDPFALIRIGDVTDLLKNELSGYEISKHFAEESYFDNLNQPDSNINILLGSRTFYEGWDSNRPNIIMYINIGTGTDARKFILQSVGRGVRIEPVKNQRKRLRELQSSGTLKDDALFQTVKDFIDPLEGLLVFGTNREALNLVMSELVQEEQKTGEHEIALEVDDDIVKGKVLLVPTYQVGDLLYRQREQAKLTLNPESAEALKSYLDYMEGADAVLLALHDSPDIGPAQISALRKYVKEGKVNASVEARPHRNLSVLASHALNYFTVYGKDFDKFKLLEDEIRHFRQIKVTLQDITELKRLVQSVINTTKNKRTALQDFRDGKITDEEMANRLSGAQKETFQAEGSVLEIKAIANHYYIPVLLSNDQKIDFIRSVIRVPSEVRFLRDLEDYVKQKDNLLGKNDWWLFSRIDEKTDDIVIPYYSPYDNKLYNFKPDFIFWLKKDDRYRILFVDPKGTSRTAYQHKVDGFRALFEKNDKPRLFNHDNMKVSVHLSLYTEDIQFVAQHYRQYWYDNVEKMVEKVIRDMAGDETVVKMEHDSRQRPQKRKKSS
jgi:uncharacterized protein (UPF0305 family)